MPVTKSATEPGGRLASVCRSHPQGRETCRLTSAGSHEVRARRQFKAAKGLRLTVLDKLLALADEVIE
jgi:hypothetical protein